MKLPPNCVRRSCSPCVPWRFRRVPNLANSCQKVAKQVSSNRCEQHLTTFCPDKSLALVPMFANMIHHCSNISQPWSNSVIFWSTSAQSAKC